MSGDLQNIYALGGKTLQSNFRKVLIYCSPTPVPPPPIDFSDLLEHLPSLLSGTMVTPWQGLQCEAFEVAN